jgi:hypothetical protein
MSETRIQERGKILAFPATLREQSATGAMQVVGTRADVVSFGTGSPIPVTFEPLIDTRRLYPEGETDSNVDKALRFLNEALARLDESRKAFIDGDLPDAYRRLFHFQALLETLFGCSSIGEGYAAIVNALHFAFVNGAAASCTEQQVNTIWRVLRELRTRPFMKLEAAADVVDELEESGLAVNPAELIDVLADFDD